MNACETSRECAGSEQGARSCMASLTEKSQNPETQNPNSNRMESSTSITPKQTILYYLVKPAATVVFVVPGPRLEEAWVCSPVRPGTVPCRQRPSSQTGSFTRVRTIRRPVFTNFCFRFALLANGRGAGPWPGIISVKSRARAAVPFSLEPKRSCANCVWLLSRLRTAALLKRIPFYNTVKQWRTLQKLALTSVDPSNTKFSFPSSLASLRQQQKALALTSPRRAKARVGGNSCKAFKSCSEQHALLQGCSKASLAYLCSSCAHQGKPKHAKTCHMPKHATTCQCYKTCRKT